MKILALADKRHPALYDYFDPARWKDVGLVVSCGDLPRDYLSYMVTVLPVPLIYVPGNHDNRYRTKPPEGCDSVDDRVVRVKGLVIGGLGGSIWYNGEGFQYRENEMRRRVKRLLRKAGRMGGLDLFVAHAPPYGIHDLDDSSHRGFTVFRTLVEESGTRVFLHGHNHELFSKRDRETVVGGVRIINAFEYHVFDIEADSSKS